MQPKADHESARPWQICKHLIRTNPVCTCKHLVNMKTIDQNPYPEHSYSIFIDLLNILKIWTIWSTQRTDKVIVYPAKYMSCLLLLPQLSKNRQVLIFDDLLVEPVFVLKPSMYVNEFILNHSNCYSLFRTMHPVGLFIWLGI